MKVLIIEDEENAAIRLSNLLRNISPDIEFLDVLNSIESSVKWFLSNPSPDLVFLDIQLADGLSFRIFDLVKVECPIIFTTAFDEFAVKAFEVNSIDYLLKPINEEKLVKSIQKFNNLQYNVNNDEVQQQMLEMLKIYKNSVEDYKTRFLINKADRLVIVPIEDIAFFVAENKEVQLITSDNKHYFVYESLDKLEKQLNPANFFRINRQIILSVNSIEKIANYFNYKLKLTLKPTTEKDIIVGRKKVKEFKEWLNK